MKTNRRSFLRWLFAAPVAVPVLADSEPFSPAVIATDAGLAPNATLAGLNAGEIRKVWSKGIAAFEGGEDFYSQFEHEIEYPGIPIVTRMTANETNAREFLTFSR